jgi:hypothetical protein
MNHSCAGTTIICECCHKFYATTFTRVEWAPSHIKLYAECEHCYVYDGPEFKETHLSLEEYITLQIEEKL